MSRLSGPEIASAYGQGLSIYAISAQDGRCPETIRSWLVRMGVPRRRHVDQPQRGLTDDAVASMLDEGMSQTGIAVIAGVSPQRIHQRVNRIRKGA